jgi:hypothetical protein
LNIKKYQIDSCCGSKQIVIEVPFPIKRELLSYFINERYSSPKEYAKTTSSLLYVENDNLIAIAAIGSNLFKIKCKHKDCSDDILSFEETLKAIKM